MKKNKKFFTLTVLFALISFGGCVTKKVTESAEASQITNLRVAVEANPNDLDAHQAYIKAVGITDPAIVKQYEKWMQKFPKSAVVPFAIGEAFANAESPKAKPWLLKTVNINPKFAKAYMDLWLDAGRWGDFEGGRKYLAMGAQSDPKDPELAFYYARSFRETDFEKYQVLSLDVAKNFPAAEGGAQALYWLALRSKESKDKISAWEQLRNQYSPDKSNWSMTGMSSYFVYLVRIGSPDKALELAQSMAKLKLNESSANNWAGLAVTAQNIVKVRQDLDEKKPADALTILDKIYVSSYAPLSSVLILLKAEAGVAAGNPQKAYDELAVYYADAPTDEIAKEIISYGAKIGKAPAQINADIVKIRYADAQPATPFTLEQYLKPGTASLENFRGKVVLLTYWFPGCGPCRAEFPYFENVVKKFNGQDLVYLGINIVPEQDDYVVPFIKTSGYSFIPLRENKERDKGNLIGGAPANFLIDKEGKVVFSGFRTDGENERTLELMINSLLTGKAI